MSQEPDRMTLHVPERDPNEETTWWVQGKDTKSTSARRRAARVRKLVMIYVVILVTTFAILITGGIAWMIYLATVPEDCDVFTPKAAVIQKFETRFRGPITDMAYSPDGKFLAVSSEDGTAIIMDAKTGETLRTLIGHKAGVTSIAVGMKSGRTSIESVEDLEVVTGSKDMYAILWELTLNPVLPRVRLGAGASGSAEEDFGGMGDGFSEVPPDGHTKAINSVAISLDGNYALSGGADKRVILWNTKLGSRYSILETHTEPVYAVAINPNGQNYASAGGDSKIRIWNIKNDSLIHTLDGHGNTVTAMSYSASGHLLISGASDGKTYVWDTTSGRKERNLEPETRVEDVAISANEAYALTNMYDDTAVLWDLKTGLKTVQYVADGRVLALAMSPVTNKQGVPLYVAAATAEGKILIYLNKLD